jgi:adenosylmethionine-8-amino-7-oxononanoate aminotransferase
METISDRDRDYIWHPFTQMKIAQPPIPIHSGKGAYLYGEKGEHYLDGISSWWVNLHGHAHPYIVQKITEQAHKLEHAIFADFTHSAAVDFASQLIPILPGEMGKIFFSDNGSTAIEVALKMAIQYWHNQKIHKTQVVCFKGGYHGDTFGAMSVSGKNAFNKPFWNYLFEVETISPPIKGEEERVFLQLEKILEEGNVACFIFEPLILGVGGMVLYPAKQLERLLQICQRYGVITIADEVMTGFGRTGTVFACDQIKEQPDIICLSKGITGGFLPLGVTACHEKIYQAFLSEDKQKALLHGHSYTANPLACASAIASLELLQSSSSCQQRTMIEKSHTIFCETWRNHPKLIRCESLGTILVLEYKTEGQSYFSPLRDSLYPFFLEKGILLRPLGNVLYVLPPYCIGEEDLAVIYDAIILSLEGAL